MSSYAELHALSHFSFLRGASSPAELLEQAAALGYRALALTDECSVAGLVRAHTAAKAHALHLIVGSEFTLDDGTQLVVLVRNRQGYSELCELITRARRRSEKGHYSLDRDDFARGLPGCVVLWMPDLAQPEKWPPTGDWLKHTFDDRARIAVELVRTGADTERLAQLTALGEQLDLPLLASGDVHMHTRERRFVQDTVTAIRHGVTLSDAGQRLFPNGERHLRPVQRLARLYPQKLLDETVRIAKRCRFSLDELHYEYPDEIVPPGTTANAYLRELTEAGLTHRYPQGIPKKIRAQIEHELELIAYMDYAPYFLTVYDIVTFARRRGILCQGRGSAANSAVCFCLGITALDPARANLLFERFISKERNEPPDIDVDFEHERREEVIQYLYAKYGRGRAAIAATVITYRPKSALRDVGKALGLDRTQLDRLSKAFTWRSDTQTHHERLAEAGFDPASPVMQQLMTLVEQLIGTPRHLSQHVGGFVLARRALADFVPVENATMANRSIIQWDKDDLDAVGLMKIDVLALGMLSALKRALALVNRQRDSRLTLATIPAEDPAVYDRLCQGDAIGLFQIESRAQMAMLPRLKPRTFYDLVVQIALIRPGPIQGEMVHPYLARRAGKEAVTYPSDAVKKVLGRTLGVPIFQEQVMALAIEAAGFTAGEADKLRRAMGAWKRSGSLAPLQQRLMDGLRQNGYTQQFAEQIYNQIEGFAEYGFPESHSASFALLAYASAWLKCHEPAAYCCALLNSQPMGFYAPAQLVADAQRHGVTVRAVDVTVSDTDCTLENSDDAQPAVRLGLSRIKNLSANAAQRLCNARATNPFNSVTDLVRRAHINRADLTALTDADALQMLSGHRHRSAWHTLGIEQPWALGETQMLEAEPLLAAPSDGQNVAADYNSTGLTLRQHPLALLREQLNHEHIYTAAELKRQPHGRLVRVAGLVTHRQRPGRGHITFITTEDETGLANIIVRQQTAEHFRAEVIGAQLLSVTGTLQRQDNIIHVIAGKLTDKSTLLGTLATRSRDFK